MSNKQRMAEQSRIWIWEAFLSLLKEKEFQAITISEIADRASLSRRTFYRYFNSKEAVVDFYFNQQIDAYLDALKANSRLSPKEVLVLLFNHWLPKRDTLRLLMKNGLFDHLLAEFSDQMTNIYDVFPAPWHIQGSQEEIQYVMAFSTAGFFYVLKIWLAKEDPESPEMLTRTFLKAFKKMSASLPEP